jgi:hypothetical protein
MGGAVWIVILLGLSAHKDGDNRIVFGHCSRTKKIEIMKTKYVWLKKHKQIHKNKSVFGIILG